MHGHNLALQMAGQFGDGYAVFCTNSCDLIAVILAARGLVQVKDPRIPRRNLHTFVTQSRGPLDNRGQGVERRFIAKKLGQEQRRAFDGIGHFILR